jgi:hypothetical protein
MVNLLFIFLIITKLPISLSLSLSPSSTASNSPFHRLPAFSPTWSPSTTGHLSLSLSPGTTLRQRTLAVRGFAPVMANLVELNLLSLSLSIGFYTHIYIYVDIFINFFIICTSKYSSIKKKKSNPKSINLEIYCEYFLTHFLYFLLYICVHFVHFFVIISEHIWTGQTAHTCSIVFPNNFFFIADFFFYY